MQLLSFNTLTTTITTENHTVLIRTAITIGLLRIHSSASDKSDKEYKSVKSDCFYVRQQHLTLNFMVDVIYPLMYIVKRDKPQK